MAKIAAISFFLIISLFSGFIVSSCGAVGNLNIEGRSSYQGKTWCVVKVGAAADKLQAFIDSTCATYDCKEIRPGGSCYQPNNVQNHASYLLDLRFRSTNVCDSQLGLPAITDPSFGKCHFP